MTQAQYMEYQITRKLIRRRDIHRRLPSPQQIIKGLAIAAAVALAVVFLQELLFVAFAASLIVGFGLS